MNYRSVILRFGFFVAFLSSSYIANCQQNKNVISVGENLDKISHFLDNTMYGRGNELPCLNDRPSLIRGSKNLNNLINNDLKRLTLIKLEKPPMPKKLKYRTKNDLAKD